MALKVKVSGTSLRPQCPGKWLGNLLERSKPSGGNGSSGAGSGSSKGGRTSGSSPPPQLVRPALSYLFPYIAPLLGGLFRLKSRKARLRARHAVHVLASPAMPPAMCCITGKEAVPVLSGAKQHYTRFTMPSWTQLAPRGRRDEPWLHLVTAPPPWLRMVTDLRIIIELVN